MVISSSLRCHASTTRSWPTRSRRRPSNSPLSAEPAATRFARSLRLRAPQPSRERGLRDPSGRPRRSADPRCRRGTTRSPDGCGRDPHGNPGAACVLPARRGSGGGCGAGPRMLRARVQDQPPFGLRRRAAAQRFVRAGSRVAQGGAPNGGCAAQRRQRCKQHCSGSVQVRFCTGCTES